MKKLTRNNIYIILFLSISACYYDIGSKQKYEPGTFNQYVITKPIYFYIDPTDQKSSAYFLLSYNISTDKYYLKLNWLLYSNNRPFLNIRNTLKFNLDDRIELIFSAIRPPKVTKISLEPYGVEEEAVFEVDRSMLEIIAHAGKVYVEINSRYRKLTGNFIHKHSFNAIADFLNKVDKVTGDR